MLNSEHLMQEIRNKIAEYLSHDSKIRTNSLAKLLKKPRHIIAYHKDQLIKNWGREF